MEEKTSTYTMRVPQDLKKAFETAAKSADITGAQLIRAWMRQYVEQYMKSHAQQDLIKPKGDKK